MPIFPGVREGNFAARQVHIDGSLRTRVIIKIDERQTAGAVSVRVEYGWFSRKIARLSSGEVLKIGQPVVPLSRDVMLGRQHFPPSTDDNTPITSGITVRRPDNNAPLGLKTLTKPGEHVAHDGGGRSTIIITAPPSTTYVVS